MSVEDDVGIGFLGIVESEEVKMVGKKNNTNKSSYISVPDELKNATRNMCNPERIMRKLKTFPKW